MQGFDPLRDHPPVLAFDTDTATPRQQIPIYYFHRIKTPFCRNPLCACQRGRNDAARLIGHVSEGVLLMHDAKPLIDGLPLLCQLYGHSWQETESPDMKACQLCGIRGYCPGCTPIAPQGAQPFYCTVHTRQSEVQ